MALPGNKNFSDYDNYITDQNPTTSAQAQDYFRNQAELLKAVIDCDFWQPETVYQPGDVVKSDSMPNGTEAVMVATKASVTSNVEPQWGAVGGANISDGACFWKLRWQHWSKENATNRLPNTNYAVGNVVYSRSNLSVALKCTQAGTTSADELDIGNKVVGESVEDGSVVWEVVSRDTVAIIDQQRPIKTFTSLEQLGLDNNATPQDVSVAMPATSKLVLVGDVSDYPNLMIDTGVLIITKANPASNFVKFDLVTHNTRRYFAVFSNYQPERFKWKQLATNGALSMPSANRINIAVSQGETFYTAPADGWLYVEIKFSSTNSQGCQFVLVNTTALIKSANFYSNSQNWGFLPVAKGDVCSIGVWSPIHNLEFAHFVYAQSEV